MRKIYRKKNPVEISEIKRTAVSAPDCFGKLFFDPNALQCEYCNCVLWSLCRQKHRLNGTFVGELGRDLIDIAPTIGNQLFEMLKADLEEYFWFHTRKKFHNVVVLDRRDKWRYRYLRVWVGEKAIRIDICPSLASALASLNWAVRYYKQYRRKTFRPHIGAISVKDKDILEKFLCMFIIWAKCREFKEIEEDLDYLDESTCTTS